LLYAPTGNNVSKLSVPCLQIIEAYWKVTYPRCST
jgi:hypothetical protein